jgi:hypothetical protein
MTKIVVRLILLSKVYLRWYSRYKNINCRTGLLCIYCALSFDKKTEATRPHLRNGPVAGLVLGTIVRFPTPINSCWRHRRLSEYEYIGCLKGIIGYYVCTTMLKVSVLIEVVMNR